MPIFNDKESRKGNRDCCDILGEGKNTNATFFLATKGGWWWKPLTSVEYKQALLFSLLPDALLNCINYFFVFARVESSYSDPNLIVKTSILPKLEDPIYFLNFCPPELSRFLKFGQFQSVKTWTFIIIERSEIWI